MNILPIFGLTTPGLTTQGAKNHAQKFAVDPPKTTPAPKAGAQITSQSPLSSETISAVYEASEAIKSTDTRTQNIEPKAPTAGEMAKAKFLEYMSLSPSELYFTLKLEAKLKAMGMTIEQFEALPPEQQQAIIAEVKTEIAEEAKKRAENKIQEARLAHSAQQAAKDLATDDTPETAEGEEEKVSELEKLALRLAENNEAAQQGRDPLTLTSFTQNEIEKTANDLYKSGKITLEELYRIQRPNAPQNADKI